MFYDIMIKHVKQELLRNKSSSSHFKSVQIMLVQESFANYFISNGNDFINTPCGL